MTNYPITINIPFHTTLLTILCHFPITMRSFLRSITLLGFLIRLINKSFPLWKFKVSQSYFRFTEKFQFWRPTTKKASPFKREKKFLTREFTKNTRQCKFLHAIKLEINTYSNTLANSKMSPTCEESDPRKTQFLNFYCKNVAETAVH